MFYKIVVFCCVFSLIAAYSDMSDVVSNLLENVESSIKVIEADLYNLEKQLKRQRQESVQIQVYYECMCPDCRQFDTQQLVPVVQKLHSYLHIQTYPYGNAKMYNRNGTYEFKCQHGPEECYGNKLHACAINILQNITEAIYFNTCMMEPSQEGRGSDDKAADVCGTSMGIRTESIKKCAKSDKGTQLLKYYGDESNKANFNYVPYILVNGKVSDGTNFMKDVCTAFNKPPEPCVEYNTLNKV